MAFNQSSQIHIQRNANNIVYGNQSNYSNNDNDSRPEILRNLAQYAAPNACYDSEQRFPPPNCHTGTRVQLIEKLSHWIEDSSNIFRVFWLYGTAGIGKSAIAQHIAEKYAGTKLAAAFFFSRNDSTRDKIGPFVASLAYQLCNTTGDSPLRMKIIDTIRNDPNVFQTSCENQARKLIIETCGRVISESDASQRLEKEQPNLIVVDGLDECAERQSQERPSRASYPDRLSRRDFSRCLEVFDINTLDTINWDIRLYLVDQFVALREKHWRVLGHEDSSWPGDRVIDQLVDRADGQFIFAVTVVKYLDTDDELPQDRLDTIMRIYTDAGSESPYSALDALYHQILSSCHKWERVQGILRLLVTPHQPLQGGERSDTFVWRSPKFISLLLNIQSMYWQPFSFRLHSVILIPDSRGDGGRGMFDNPSIPIVIAHASFSEFLSDSNRSGPFHTPKMTVPEYCDCVATTLIRELSAFAISYPFYHLQSFADALSLWFEMVWHAEGFVKFSCESWDRYCLKVVSPSANLLCELEKLDIYPVIAMSVAFKKGLPLERERIIQWAKGLNNPNLQTFIEDLEDSNQELYITFSSKGISESRLSVLSDAFMFEQRLYCLGSGLTDFQRRVIGDLTGSHVKAEVDVWCYGIEQPKVRRRGYSRKIGSSLRITKKNAEVFKRVSNELDDERIKFRYSPRDMASRIRYTAILLLEDIKNDTRVNLSRFPRLRENDLVHLVASMRERIEALSLEFSDEGFKLVETVKQDDVGAGSPSSQTLTGHRYIGMLKVKSRSTRKRKESPP
ncbi:hypothetical protein VNI00_009113 [Paramarasmius palmivorus]|uniref:Nephrocystin 3-like N-terminal domain-containing protein n=1 Tax=Paramarasmius palmivorus TaxID=297713 RepID=A0AAW0CRI3_9AGAR